MPTPPLTPEARAAALRKATATRMARRAFKDEVSIGNLSLAGALARARADDVLAGIRVSDLLRCLPRVGPKRASALLGELGIAESRRVRGLGAHQVERLVRRVG